MSLQQVNFSFMMTMMLQTKHNKHVIIILSHSLAAAALLAAAVVAARPALVLAMVVSLVNLQALQSKVSQSCTVSWRY